MKYNFINKTLVKDTAIYTVTDMLGKAMSFVLIPIVSFYLSPDELGLATNFTVMTSMLILLAGVAIVNSIPYFFYEQDKDENNALISNLLILAFFVCTFFCFVILVFSSVINEYLKFDIYVQYLAVVYVICSLISQTNLLLYRLEDKPKLFALFQIVQIVLHALFVVLFVIIVRGGGVGKIYAEVMVFLFMGIIHAVMLRRRGYLVIHINTSWMKKLIIFGLPLLPHSISFWFKSGTDKILITTFCGLFYNGLYSMALSVASIYTMLVNSFFNAYTPYLQKRLAQMTPETETREKKSIVKQTYFLFFLFFVVAVLTICGSWIIFEYMLNQKYLPAFQYLPLIIIAYFIYSFYSFVVNYIYKVKKTLVMGIITFTGSLIQMTLSYFMIEDFGVMGAVYSLLLGNALVTIGIFIYSNMVYPMPWFFRPPKGNS